MSQFKEKFNALVEASRSLGEESFGGAMTLLIGRDHEVGEFLQVHATDDNTINKRTFENVGTDVESRIGGGTVFSGVVTSVFPRAFVMLHVVWFGIIFLVG